MIIIYIIYKIRNSLLVRDAKHGWLKNLFFGFRNNKYNNN